MAIDPISIALEIGSKIIDRLWPDPTQAAAAKLELFKMQQAGELSIIAGQLDINKIEAGSDGNFKGGWRPAVGWVCASAFSVQYIIGPLSEWIAALNGHPVKFPELDMVTMLPILFGMLGLGAYRTTEKVKGVS